MMCCKAETGVNEYLIDQPASAKNWFDKVKSDQIPITVKRETCTHCGKWQATIYSTQGQLIHKRKGQI